MEKNHGICLQPFIPVRAENSERSEMVTQLLFGEICRILGRDPVSRFCNIRNLNDGYEGWIDEKTIQFITDTDFSNVIDLPVKITRERQFRVVDKLKCELWLSAGSTLRIEPGNNIYGTLSMYSPDLRDKSKREIMEDASQEWVNVAYIWGGKSTFGTDCSGLTQNIYKQAGLDIPRDASEQSTQGKSVNFVFEAQPGDLAFFDDEEGVITHVGIILSSNRILHSSGKVRVDLFDQQGIYSREKGNYTHKLRLMRNLID
ncbi:MAG: NlpC/P60 family protein [Bacteroidales bacterium]